MSGIGSMPPPASPATVVWSVLRLPLQILCLGGVVLLLIWAAMQIPVPAGFSLGLALPGDFAQLVIGAMVFLIGVSFAAFLWWLSRNFFALLTSGKLTAESAASLRDLPMALPEGTVRSVLALLVGVVGLPILIFSKLLQLDDPIPGYVNGIIIGVFGFYFGSRTTGVPQQAVTQIAAAQTRATEAERGRNEAELKVGVALQAADVAGQLAATSQKTAAGLTRAGKFSDLLDQLSRHTALAGSLLDVIGPALPKGVLSSTVTDTINTARSVLDAVQKVAPEQATEDQVKQMADVTGALLGGQTSPLGALLSLAAPLLGSAGLGPLGLLLSVGAKLGAHEFQRWKARVLAAPVSTEIIPAGTITPSDVEEAFHASPPLSFASAFGVETQRAGFFADLASWVLRDDAPAVIWDKYGDAAASPLFNTRAQVQDGLDQLRQTLLAARGRSDVTSQTVGSVATTLSAAVDPGLRLASGTSISTDQANAAIDKAAAVSASGQGPQPQLAALDALVTLVGIARSRQIDLPTAVAEVKTS